MQNQRYLTSALDNSLNVSKTSKRKKKLEDFEFIERESKYGKTGELGKGAYGVVRLVRDKVTGVKYAMKIVKKSLIEQNNTLTQVRNEIKIQRKLKHPHIVRLRYFFEDTESVYLILSYCEKGTLYEYIKAQGKNHVLQVEEAFIYFLQTSLAVEYLHQMKIIHRDIKPENLLLDSKKNIQVSDFGWSAKKTIDSEKRTTYCGTIDYMAPEMVKNSRYDEKVDIWSLGVLLYELTQNSPPFAGKNYAEKNSNILNCKMSPFKHNISSECKDLIRMLLNPEPLRRPTMDEIFDHDFVKNNAEIMGLDVQRQRDKIRKSALKKKRRKSTILGGLDDSRSEMKRRKSHNGMAISVVEPGGRTIDQILAADQEIEESGFGMLSSQNHNISTSKLSAFDERGSKKRKKKKKKKKEKKTMYGLDECLDLLGGGDDELDLLNNIDSTVNGKKSAHTSSRNIRTKDRKRDRSKSKSKSGIFDKGNTSIPPKAKSSIGVVTKATKKGIDFGSSRKVERNSSKRGNDSNGSSRIFKHPPKANNRDFEPQPEPEDDDVVLQESRNPSIKGTVDTNFSNKNKAPGPPPGYKKPSERIIDDRKPNRPNYQLSSQDNAFDLRSTRTENENMLSFGGPKSSRGTGGGLSTQFQTGKKNGLSSSGKNQKRNHVEDALFESGFHEMSFKPQGSPSKKQYNFADSSLQDFSKDSYNNNRKSDRFEQEQAKKPSRKTKNDFNNTNKDEFEDLFSSRFRDKESDDIFNSSINKAQSDMNHDMYFVKKNLGGSKAFGNKQRNYVIEEGNEEMYDDEVKESHVKNRYRDDLSSGYGDAYENRALGGRREEGGRSKSNNAGAMRMDKKQASKWLNSRADPSNLDMDFLPKHQKYRQVDINQSYSNLLRQNELMKKQLEDLKKRRGKTSRYQSQTNHNINMRKTRRLEKEEKKVNMPVNLKGGFIGRLQSFLDVLGCTTGNRKME